MTFTYNLAHADATKVLISKVRLEIGDTVENAGIRPNLSNLSDEEISYWLTEEDNDVMLAAARACDAMARAWAIVANETAGPRKTEYGKVSGDWAKLAATIRNSSERPVVYAL